MTCQYDRELVALYAGGDLPEDEVKWVSDHVQGCAGCQALVEQYRSGASRLAAEGAGARYTGPDLPARPARSRAWLAVAAAALVAVLSLAAQSPAVAEMLQTVGSRLQVGIIKVIELDPTEFAAYTREVQFGTLPDEAFGPDGVARDEDGAVLAIRPVVTTLEAAQQQSAFQIRLPAYLPEGYTLRAVSTILDWVELEYSPDESSRPRFIGIMQKAPATELIITGVPQGSSEPVMIGSVEGLLVRGQWDPNPNPDGSRNYIYNDRLYLQFVQDEMLFMMTSTELSAEELIRVAESLR